MAVNQLLKLFSFRSTISLKAPPWIHPQELTCLCNRAHQSTAALPLEEIAKIRPISEMPGLKSYPFIGNALAIIANKDFQRNNIPEFWQSLREELGPIFKLQFPLLPPMVGVSDPVDVEKVFRVTMNNPIRDGFYSLRKIRQDAVDDYFEQKCGLLTENNEEWYRVRSRVQTPMMKPKNIIKFLPQLDVVTLQFMDIINKYQQELGEMPPDFLEELYKWSLEAVGLVALNRRLGCLEPNLLPDSTPLQLLKSVNSMFQYLHDTEFNIAWWKIFPTSSYRNLKKSHDFFLQIADKNIRETEAELKSKRHANDEEELTLMETLLKTEGLSRKDVVTLILDMLFAGVDTTSHTLGFTLYLLARNPKAQKRLQEELDSVLGDGSGAITEKHLARLSYLKACVKESLRLFPITLGTARTLEVDTVLSGYNVPSGYQVFVMGCLISADESVFSRAKEFLPERWARDQPLGPIHPFAFLPFSHGTRMCIGRRIAEQEIFVFLARALHRFQVDYKYEDVETITRVVSVPSRPLKFEFIERK